MSPATVRAFLDGGRNRRLTTVDRIAAAVGLDLRLDGPNIVRQEGEVMLTSYYACPKIDSAVHAPIRISIGNPRFRRPYKDAGRILALAPDRAWLGLPREQYEPLYVAKLEQLDLDLIRADIARLAGTRIPVLLCFEHLAKPGAWCHRRMFAAWWERKTGEMVGEL
jgi:hypothetical protein